LFEDVQGIDWKTNERDMHCTTSMSCWIFFGGKLRLMQHA
jgi:hypothetical protein